MKHLVLLIVAGLAIGFAWRYALGHGDRAAALQFARRNLWAVVFIVAIFAMVVAAFYSRSISIL